MGCWEGVLGVESEFGGAALRGGWGRGGAGGSPARGQRWIQRQSPHLVFVLLNTHPALPLPWLPPPPPPRRPEFRLVVTSATLDGDKFSAYFGACPVFNVPGRCFPVNIIHSLEDHSRDYAEAAVDTALDIHCNQPEGAAGGGAQGAGSAGLLLATQAGRGTSL